MDGEYASLEGPSSDEIAGLPYKGIVSALLTGSNLPDRMRRLSQSSNVLQENHGKA